MKWRRKVGADGARARRQIDVGRCSSASAVNAPGAVGDHIYGVFGSCGANTSVYGDFAGRNTQGIAVDDRESAGLSQRTREYHRTRTEITKSATDGAGASVHSFTVADISDRHQSTRAADVDRRRIHQQ